MSDEFIEVEILEGLKKYIIQTIHKNNYSCAYKIYFAREFEETTDELFFTAYIKADGCSNCRFGRHEDGLDHFHEPVLFGKLINHIINKSREDIKSCGGDVKF